MDYLSQANLFLRREFSDKHTDILPEQVSDRLKKQLIKVTKQKQSAKADKSNVKHGEYYNLILYLIPGDLIGRIMCVNYDTCLGGCLVWSGRGGTYEVMRARVIKTLALLNYPDKFRARLARDVELAKAAVAKQGKRLVLRLNGTSDLHPRTFGIKADLDVIRYEYTKSIAFALRGKSMGIHYTYSHYGNLPETKQATSAGINISVVLEHNQELPAWIKELLADGWNLVDGDEHDLRFLDSDKSVVILRAKAGGFTKSDKRTKLSEVA